MSTGTCTGTHAMCKRCDDRMDPFAMDFDDKEENKEMTDDDFTDITPEYMFQKFKLVLFSAGRQHSIPWPCVSTETSR